MANSDYNPPTQTKWNLDEARMKSLNWYMMLCEDAFEQWNVESINTHLRTIRRIISGAVGDESWENIDKEFEKLEKIKREFDNSNKKNLSKKGIEFYNKADEIYIKLNRGLQQSGFFFRKGDDVRFAALKR